MKRWYVAILAVVLFQVMTVEARQLSRSVNKPMKAACYGVSQTVPSVDVTASGDWTVLGDAVWEEDIMSYFSDIPSGKFWNVPIEQSVSDPTKYRLAPYAVEGNPVADVMGSPDATYIYLNAADPSRVMVDDFTIYDVFRISQLIKENDWSTMASDANYGVMGEGFIEFGSRSFAVYVRNSGYGWDQTCANGFKIYLPGQHRKDYSCNVGVTSMCADGDRLSFTATCGADVKTLKALVLAGAYFGSDELYSQADKVNGAQEIKPGVTVSFNPPADSGHQRYSVIVLAYDSDGHLVGGDTDFFYALANNPEQWTSVGTATFNEFVLTGAYSDIESEVLVAPLERHVTNPSLYRLVNPYSGHSLSGRFSPVGHDHDHYMYLNVGNSNFCYLIDSPIGMSITGDAAICTYGYYYLEAGYTVEEIMLKGYGGTLEDNVVTFKSGDILFAEKEYGDGAWAPYLDGTQMSIVLNIENDGIKDVENDLKGPVTFYNLSGVRVESPEAGQIVLRQQGNKVTKSIIK